jgi:hypothetical protein
MARKQPEGPKGPEELQAPVKPLDLEGMSCLLDDGALTKALQETEARFREGLPCGDGSVFTEEEVFTNED